METNDRLEILLVEDNTSDAELCLRALKKQNLANKLFWVKDGAEALDYIFATGTYAERNIEHTPSVILLDLKLPKVSGLEVLKRLKSDERTQLIPIVMLTSSTEEADRLESYKLGANSFISKPVQFEEFAKVVADMGMYWLMINKPPS